eukprot:358478-Chlamydomonas_euryale.AAC.6
MLRVCPSKLKPSVREMQIAPHSCNDWGTYRQCGRQIQLSGRECRLASYHASDPGQLAAVGFDKGRQLLVCLAQHTAAPAPGRKSTA